MTKCIEKRGPGRPPKPDNIRKRQIGLKLPPGLIAAMDARPESRAVQIEKAWGKKYGDELCPAKQGPLANHPDK